MKILPPIHVPILLCPMAIVGCDSGDETVVNTGTAGPDVVQGENPLDALDIEFAQRQAADAAKLAEVLQIPQVTVLGHPPEDIPLMRSALPANSGLDPWGRPRESFVNWETPHVHPIDMTPAGDKLLAVNTAANTLMIFNDNGGTPALIKSVPVGLDPVSVRAISSSRAWVVNLASDSISIVDLDQGVVIDTLSAEDEPADVVFAGSKAFVSCSQANRVNVFDTNNLAAAPQSIFINGEDPRAMAVSPDGSKVYVAIFESGNKTSLVNGGTRNELQVDFVGRGDSPYNGNPMPPNSGNQVEPPMNPALPNPPPTSIIVRKQDDGRWLDGNQKDWTYAASPASNFGRERVANWDLPDRDLAIIDAASLSVSYESGLMNALMAMDVNPVSGDVLVVGTDSTNEVRYEPNMRGTFVQVLGAAVSASGGSVLADLNPHLDYQSASVPQAIRTQSIGDPRGVEFAEDGSFAMVTGMGSNNVIVVSANGDRQAVAPVTVGEGPTGIVLHPSGGRAYVLNKFDGSISTLSIDSWQESSRVEFYDPTPTQVKRGRKHFYNTHQTSGLGQASCASCHIDARTDRLAWDLGDPRKDMINANGVNHHPLKGPMLTQTLQDAMRHNLMHWRGDVEDLAHGFTGTPEGLQGADRGYTPLEVAEMETFLDSIHMPSNPNRALDNSYRTSLEIPGPNNTVARVGNAAQGAQEFEAQCRTCHHGHTGRGNNPMFADAFGVGQMRLAPSWRGFHERFGIWYSSVDGSNTGFGTQQNGSFDSTHNGTRSNNLMAFMQSYTGRFPYTPRGADNENQSQDTHAAVGQQLTFSGALSGTQEDLLDQLQAMANRNEIGLIVKSRIANNDRGFAYMGGGGLQSDRDSDSTSLNEFIARVAAESLLTTITAVPAGSEIRLAIDADSDSTFDFDETLAGTDPHDPASFLEPDCDNTQDIAQLAGTRQSSGHNGDSFPSQLAIDGDPATFTHTDGADANATLWLDLNSDYTLKEIQLLNRTNCCGDRLRDITVEVIDRDGASVFQSALLNPGNSLGSPATITLPLDGSVRGRKLRISRKASGQGGDAGNVLSLGEVKVNACISSFIGQIPTPPQATNLLSNGSFESGTDSWLPCSDNAFTSSTDSSSGNLSLQVAGAACAYQEFPVTAGKTYTMKCSAKRSGAGYASTTLTYQTLDYTVLEARGASVGDNGNYAFYRTSYAAPANSGLGAVTLYGENNAHFDDCSVVEGSASVTPPIPEPALPAGVLANGGFEQSLDNWESCGINASMAASADAAGGVQSAQLTSQGCIYQEFPLQPSESMSMQCKAKRQGGDYVSVTLSSVNAVYQPINQQEVAVESTSYSDIAAQVPASPNAKFGVVTLYSEDVANFDDCAVSIQ